MFSVIGVSSTVGAVAYSILVGKPPYKAGPRIERYAAGASRAKMITSYLGLIA